MTKKKQPTPFDLDKTELESLDELFQSFYKTNPDQSHVGNLVVGRFLSTNDRDYYFDIGGKVEGVCPQSEFHDQPNIGEEVSFVVLQKPIDGATLLSKNQADQRIAWQNIKEAHKEETNLSGEIKKNLSAGYLVSYEGLDLFLPLSHANLKSHSTACFQPGEKIDFRVIGLKEDYHSAVISHRILIEERNDILWDQFLQNHALGDIIEGTVAKRVSFGVFLEVDSLLGLLHINDISWSKKRSFKKKLPLKSKIQVKILAMNRENNHLNLGLKQLTEDPWEWARRELQVQQKIQAHVTSLANFGAFLEIHEGLEAFLHSSELSWDRKSRHPKDYIHIEEEIEVVIMSIDIENKRISLSRKQLLQDPWEAVGKTIKVGDVCTGEITGVVDFGNFVKISDGIEGLVHQKDYSWENSPQKSKYKRGETVQFKILNINHKERRIACGFKQLAYSPHQLFKKQNPKGSAIKVKVKRIAPFGVVVSLDKELEGTIRIHEANLKPEQKAKDIYKIGDEIHSIVQDVDLNKRRIYLSIKGYKKKQEVELIKQYVTSEASPLTATPFAELLGKRKDT